MCDKNLESALIHGLGLEERERESDRDRDKNLESALIHGLGLVVVAEH